MFDGLDYFIAKVYRSVSLELLLNFSPFLRLLASQNDEDRYSLIGTIEVIFFFF